MKATTTAIIGVATSFLVAACVMLEDRIAQLTTPEIAAAAISTSCIGGRDFVAAATATLDQTASAVLVKGVEASCALRAERKPISSTVYDRAIDQFCHETAPLEPGEADDVSRDAFNSQRAQICEGHE